jgi:hypothetical protein
MASTISVIDTSKSFSTWVFVPHGTRAPEFECEWRWNCCLQTHHLLIRNLPELRAAEMHQTVYFQCMEDGPESLLAPIEAEFRETRPVGPCLSIDGRPRSPTDMRITRRIVPARANQRKQKHAIIWVVTSEECLWTMKRKAMATEAAHENAQRHRQLS